MKLVQNFLYNNPCFYGDGYITVKGLMLHSVGCPQPDPKVFINQWNNASYGAACVHAFVDATQDNTVYQTLPWNHRGWHGGGSSNDTHIGVEMCEPAEIRYTSGANFTCSNIIAARIATKRTYDSAIELFAMLCEKFNLNPMTQICSHAEGYRKGIATNHGDPEHLWNGLSMGYTMDTFRKAVKAKMSGTAAQQTDNTVTTSELYRVRKTWTDAKSQLGAFKSLESAKKLVDSNKGYSVFAASGKAVYPISNATDTETYKVKITADVLNIRSGPGLSNAVTGTVKQNEVYTIVDTKTADGYTWGKLKSGAGYIALTYTTKL